jgi:hypothetical protein
MANSTDDVTSSDVTVCLFESLLTLVVVPVTENLNFLTISDKVNED